VPEKVIEQTSGKGKVFDGREVLAECQYEVAVYERYVDTTSVGRRSTSLSNANVGRVDLRITSTSPSLHVDSHKRLTLHLDPPLALKVESFRTEDKQRTYRITG